MSFEKDVEIAHGTCPCWLPPWAATKCRNCAVQQQHHIDNCEWRGHAAILRLLQMSRLDALEAIKGFVDQNPAISVEVRKVLQGAA